MPTNNHVLNAELDCTITNVTNHDTYNLNGDIDKTYNKFSIKSDDVVKTFNKHTNLNVAYDKFWDAEGRRYLFIDCNDTAEIMSILYNSDNEIVAILPGRTDCDVNGETEEYAFTTNCLLSKDIEVSKITVVVQYFWADNSFE